MTDALLFGLVNDLSDGFARFISALLIPNSVTDFLGLVHVLALILALVLPDRVAHIGSRLPRLALFPLDGLADRLADGDAALVGAAVETADSIVRAVRTVVLSWTPADRLGLLGRAPVPGRDHRAGLGLGDILADFVLHPFGFGGADFLRFVDVLAVVLALVLPDGGAHLRPRLLRAHFVLHGLVLVHQDGRAGGSRGSHRRSQGDRHFH